MILDNSSGLKSIFAFADVFDIKMVPISLYLDVSF